MIGIILLYFFAAISIASAVAVVSLPKVVHSIAMMLVFLISISAIFINMYAEYIALIVLMVHAGAIMVLYLFAMILFTDTANTVSKNIARYSTILMVVVLFTLVGIWSVVSFDVLSQKLLGAEALEESLSIASFSNAMFGNLLLPFEMVSIILLIAMMGTIIISSNSSSSRR